MAEVTLRIPPYHYIHVLDKNTYLTRLELGPQAYARQDQETVITGENPVKMIIIPPYNYCEILNPVVRDSTGSPILDSNKQPKVQSGEREYRFREGLYAEPFPLYPKEVLIKISPMTIIPEGSYLKIEALRDFVNDAGKKIIAGEQWNIKGPSTYKPRVEENALGIKQKYVVAQNEAVRLKAERDYNDVEAKKDRIAGDEWILDQPGSYYEHVYESIQSKIRQISIPKDSSLHLRAEKDYVDVYDKPRRAGDEWLITNDISPSHIIGIYETNLGMRDRIILSSTQYCVIKNPYNKDTGKNKFGEKIITRGPGSFFLQPGESIEGKINNLYILGDFEAVLLKARETCKQPRIPNEMLREEVHNLLKKGEKDKILLIKSKLTGNIRVGIKGRVDKKSFEEYYALAKDETLESFLEDIVHQPGDRWMEYGPMSYLPSVEVEVIRVVEEIPLDKNEGIYVRNNKTGEVRAVIGETYMLKPYEDLYSLELSSEVENLIAKQKDTSAPRDKTKVVTFNCPYNSAVQIFDFKTKENRIVFGPELIMLHPDETITVLNLSGSKPKKPGVVTTLYLLLGPDFSTDICEVETSDHAKLRIQLSYNWQFKIDRNNKKQCEKIFTVRDFVGDLCNIMAAKVRSAVAGVSFENFHKSSARLIRTSIFGTDESGKIKDGLFFDKNNLLVSNVDIQLVEPVDARTKRSLKETVSLAIEISTKTQEEEASRQASKADQENAGQLNKMSIEDEAKAEQARKKLLALEIECGKIKQIGESNAEANAESKAELYKAESKLQISKLKADAKKLVTESEIDREEKIAKLTIEYEQKISEIEIKKKKDLASIEAKKFEDIMTALGKETLVSIANAGPEMQAKLLDGLGLKGFLLTDGTSPINLFNAAQGLIGSATQQRKTKIIL